MWMQRVDKLGALYEARVPLLEYVNKIMYNAHTAAGVENFKCDE